MTDPASGPFLFDTSADSWLARAQSAEVRAWIRQYLALHQIYVSAVTVLERSRGYALLWQSVPEARRDAIEVLRLAYLKQLGQVFAVDTATAVLAGEIMALIPQRPSPPRRTHSLAESRQDRLSRWQFDALIRNRAGGAHAFNSQQPGRLRNDTRRHRTLADAVSGAGTAGIAALSSAGLSFCAQ